MCERPAAPAISHLAHTCPAVASRGLASVTGTTQTHRFLYDTGRCPWTSRQLSSDGSWLILIPSLMKCSPQGQPTPTPRGVSRCPRCPSWPPSFPGFPRFPPEQTLGPQTPPVLPFPSLPLRSQREMISPIFGQPVRKSTSPLLTRAIHNGPTVARSLRPFYLVTLIKH